MGTARIEWKTGILFESGGLSYRSRYGDSPTPSGIVELADGTGSGQFNSVYESTFSILTGGDLQFDLKGGNGELDVLNVALAFTKVKGVEIILITTPVSGVSLRFGPQGVTNAAQLWFQAAATNFWEEIRDRMAKFDQTTGWTIDGTHKVLALHNPSAGTVAGWIRVLGTK